MAEGARLERGYTGNRIGGSNPPLSAMFFMRALFYRYFVHARPRCPCSPDIGAGVAVGDILSWLVRRNSDKPFFIALKERQRIILRKIIDNLQKIK